MWLLSADNSAPPERIQQIPTALLSGYAVYTTFCFPLPDRWLETHLQRLQQNARTLGLSWDFSIETLCSQLQACVSTEQPVARLTLYPSSQHLYQLFEEQLAPSQLLLSTRANGKPRSSISLKTVLHTKPFPAIKMTGIGDMILFKRQALAEGYDDILLLNHQGHITEASTANFFALDHQGQLWTPAPERDGCLPGITRQQLFEAARNRHLPIHTQSSLTPNECSQWAGAFITNAVQGLIAVKQIDHHVLPWPTDSQELLDRLQQEWQRIANS